MSRFRQYEIFATVLEEGTLSAAASKLDVSVSAISKQLTALESATTVQLLDRTTRGIQATDSGREFYRRCKDILRAVEQAEDGLLSAEKAVSGRLSVALPNSLARSSIIDVLQRFSQQYPDIRYEIDLKEDVQNLHDTNTDFAFRIGRLEDSTHIVAIPLIKVRPVFCATTDYFDRYGRPDRIEELFKHHSIFTEPVNLPRNVKQCFKRQGFSINDLHAHKAGSIEVVHEAVRSGMCMGILTDISVENELRDGVFVDVFPNMPAPCKQLYLLFRRSHRPTQKHKIFKDHVRNHFVAMRSRMPSAMVLGQSS